MNPTQNLEIIFENKDYLVINKPAGLIVHGGPGIKEETLVDILIKKYPEIKEVGDDLTRPGIVHRLDKEASGLMIVCKNNSSFNYFKDLFQTRKIVKKYSTLVYGQTTKDEGIINFPIKRSRDGFKMAALPVSSKSIDEKNVPGNRDRGTIRAQKESKEAITEFIVNTAYINYTLLDVIIKTGRTHQIRVHFFAYGHPLVGDPLYHTPKTKRKNEKINLSRIFLVAKELRFIDPSGEEKIFTIELPKELQNFLLSIK